MTDGTRLACGALALGAALGCRSEPSPSRADARVEALAQASPPSSVCVPRIAETIGVSFLRVCPSQLAPGVDTAPFWISVIPMGCSAGEHETVRCPPVVALVQPRLSDPQALRSASSQLAAVVESDIAHKICTMRFAGRLPTGPERALARTALGLSSALVTESQDVGGYRLQELPEWVTETACEQPTVLGPECGVRGFPSDATATIAWDRVTKCEVKPLAALDGRALIGIGGDCAISRTAAEGGLLRDVPCAVRGPAADPRGRRDAAVALACHPREPAPARLSGLATDVAAFRCVIAEWR